MSNVCQLIHINMPLFLNRLRIKSFWLLMLLLASLNVSAASFFQDGFESGDLTHGSNGALWGGSTRVSVSPLNPKDGTKSLKFTFPGGANGKDAFAEQRFRLGGNYPELWIKYDLYVPSNYYHREQQSIGFSSDNNKFIYLWSGEYSAGFTGPGLSVQNWPVSGGESRGDPKAKGPIGTFDKFFGGGRLIEVEDKGKWITIIIHAKYATSANNDGVFQLWKVRDGGLISVFNKTNGNWYVPGQPGFDQGYLLGWANSGFDNETIMYIDNIEFSTTPLTAGTLAIPKPPQTQVQ